MGVTNLWTILAPVKQHVPLSSLQGQTVAVDLSIWVCENQCVKSMQGSVLRPYLRNLFFRVSYMTQLGVKLVFVIEGVAPQMKWQEMRRRQQALGRGGNRTGSRSNFNAKLRECCHLLDLLGIPYVHSKGEAEAMCAALNAAGIVDACITDDGDAFLYGALTVYRNFTMNSKDPHVESYCMRSAEHQLGVCRESLVGVALLLGCDYLAGGVHGVGVDRVIKYLESIKGISLLERFKAWPRMTASECVSKVEIFIRQKAMMVPEFPQKQVIREFLCAQETVPRHQLLWRRPQISKTQDYAETKLEWPADYTTAKVLPLVTLWDLSHHKEQSRKQLLQPKRIVKPRIRHGVPVYEVEWFKEADDTKTGADFYVTMEDQNLFSSVYPLLVADLEEEMAAKKTKKKTGSKKTKKREESVEEELSNQLQSLNVKDVQNHAFASSNPASDMKVPENISIQNLDPPRTTKKRHDFVEKELTKQLQSLNMRKSQNTEHNSAIVSSDRTSEAKAFVDVTKNGLDPSSSTQHFISRSVFKMAAVPVASKNGADCSRSFKGRVSVKKMSDRKMLHDSAETGQEVASEDVSDEELDKENEEVFLSLSQRLQKKLGKASKVRTASSSFEQCLALTLTQKKRTDESNGNSMQQEERSNVRGEFRKVDGDGEFTCREEAKLKEEEDVIVITGKDTIASSSVIHQAACLPEHDFTYVEDMVTVIQTPTAKTSSETCNLRSSFRVVQTDAEGSGFLDWSDCPIESSDLLASEERVLQKQVSISDSKCKLTLDSNSGNCYIPSKKLNISPDSSTKLDSSPSNRHKQFDVLNETPDLSVLRKDFKILLNDTFSPVQGIELSKNTTSVQSPFSVTAAESSLQFGNFSIQASLLNDTADSVSVASPNTGGQLNPCLASSSSAETASCDLTLKRCVSGPGFVEVMKQDDEGDDPLISSIDLLQVNSERNCSEADSERMNLKKDMAISGTPESVKCKSDFETDNSETRKLDHHKNLNYDRVAQGLQASPETKQSNKENEVAITVEKLNPQNHFSGGGDSKFVSSKAKLTLRKPKTTDSQTSLADVKDLVTPSSNSVDLTDNSQSSSEQIYQSCETRSVHGNRVLQKYSHPEDVDDWSHNFSKHSSCDLTSKPNSSCRNDGKNHNDCQKDLCVPVVISKKLQSKSEAKVPNFYEDSDSDTVPEWDVEPDFGALTSSLSDSSVFEPEFAEVNSTEQHINVGNSAYRSQKLSDKSSFITEKCTTNSPVSLMDRLRVRLSSNSAQNALKTLSKTSHGGNLNVKPL